MSDQDAVRCPYNAEVIEYRIEALETAIGEISRAVQSIAETTAKIARLEERHTETRAALERAFGAITKTRDELHEAERRVENRLSKLEKDMPAVKETSTWVKSGVLVLVGVVLLASIKLSLKF